LVETWLLSEVVLRPLATWVGWAIMAIMGGDNVKNGLTMAKRGVIIAKIGLIMSKGGVIMVEWGS